MYRDILAEAADEARPQSLTVTVVFLTPDTSVWCCPDSSVWSCPDEPTADCDGSEWLLAVLALSLPASVTFIKHY